MLEQQQELFRDESSTGTRFLGWYQITLIRHAALSANECFSKAFAEFKNRQRGLASSESGLKRSVFESSIIRRPVLGKDYTMPGNHFSLLCIRSVQIPIPGGQQGFGQLVFHTSFLSITAKVLGREAYTQC